MEKAVSGNLANFVDRRLHPVRLSIGHLNRLLENNKNNASINVNRELLVSITSTLEIFLEDFEDSCTGSKSSFDDRKTVDNKISETPRVTQTRVS
ncbi:MAG: hypothetical protein ABIK28_02840 [Planctomycetota bacterium]